MGKVTEVVFLEAALILDSSGKYALHFPRGDYRNGRVDNDLLMEVDKIANGRPSLFWRVVDNLKVKRTLFGDVLLKWYDEPNLAATLSIDEYRQLRSYL